MKSDPSGNFSMFAAPIISGVLAAHAIPTFSSKRCYCGKDVTKALDATYQNVVSRFNNLSNFSKTYNCGMFKNANPLTAALAWVGAAPAAWDMTFITWEWAKHMRVSGDIAVGMKKCGASKECHETVGVNKGCYYSWNVNYLLYGWINDLCGISYEVMAENIRLWKTAKGEGSDRPRLWATVGYTYGTSGLRTPYPTPTKYKNCKECSEYKANKTLNSTWPF